jgi:hypothetical protein
MTQLQLQVPYTSSRITWHTTAAGLKLAHSSVAQLQLCASKTVEISYPTQWHTHILTTCLHLLLLLLLCCLLHSCTVQLRTALETAHADRAAFEQERTALQEAFQSELARATSEATSQSDSPQQREQQQVRHTAAYLSHC